MYNLRLCIEIRITMSIMSLLKDMATMTSMLCLECQTDIHKSKCFVLPYNQFNKDAFTAQMWDAAS